MSSSWVAKKTIDGMDYFYNTSTKALTWDKPDALKTAEERRVTDQNLAWVPDEAECFVQGRIIKEGKKILLQGKNGKKVSLPKEAVWRYTPSSLTMLENDIVMLDFVNTAQILHTLKERYRQNEIYTWVGAAHSVLISINPYQSLPLYTPITIEEHWKPPANKVLAPHTYDIARRSYLNLNIEQQNQAILISGESGAGKTECAKQCFSFLAEVAGSDSNVENKILMANPVLETFGNAKTLRNNNSSRFGKWVEIHFNQQGKIESARIDNYLLEKSRLVGQQTNERNFHIFYQLFSSREHRSRFKLTAAEDFRFLAQSGCVKVKGIDDSKDFEELNRAFTLLKIPAEEVEWVLSTVAGILWLGNLEFSTVAIKGTAGVGSKVSSETALENAAEFLHVKKELLSGAVTQRTIIVNRNRTTIPLDPDAARDAASSLAKSIYGKLFDWLVKRINQATKGDKGNFIGVLDIFGFEIFERNSFEQLCINYANEKLQQHFNKQTFKEEEAVYVFEEIKFEPVPFIDNKPVLHLIEGKPCGMLVSLDDALKVGKTTDEKWVSNMDKQHGKKKCYVLDTRLRRKFPLMFQVQHYAGMVKYDAQGFLEKNKDSLFLDGEEALNASSSPLMAHMYRKRNQGPRQNTTASSKFRKQLSSLMVTLNKCEPGYIRCIKPNSNKAKLEFNSRMCMEQLRYAGVYEAVSIRKIGFPFRLSHKQFLSRYHCILMQDDRSWLKLEGNTIQERIESLVKQARADVSGVVVGKTRCLYRAPEHRLLQLMRHLALERLVPDCQRVVRGFFAREMKRRLLKANEGLRRALDVGNDIELLQAAMVESTNIIGSFAVLFDFNPPLVNEVINLIRKLEQWTMVTKEFERLETTDPNSCFADLASAINMADSIMDIPHTEFQTRMYDFSKKRLSECAAVRIDPEARASLEVLDRDRMVKILEEARADNYNSPELEEIADILSWPESKFVKAQLKRAVELKDQVRRMNREIRLTEIYLLEHKMQFEFTKYPHLRHPVEFASRSWLPWRRKELAATMLIHQVAPVHASLTDYNVSVRSLHKCILGYMGDRRYPNRSDLAVELVTQGYNNVEIATEIFCLIIKQLTKNVETNMPSPEATRDGRALMALCCSTLAIGPDFENYLLSYLMFELGLDGSKMIAVLNERKYQGLGVFTSPPSASEVQGIIDRVFARKGRSSEDVRSAPTFSRQRSVFKLNDTGLGGRKVPAAATGEVLDHEQAEKETEIALADPDVNSTKEANNAAKSCGKSANTSGDKIPEVVVHPVPPGKRKLAKAGWNFDPPMHDENMLAFKEGEILVILETADDGWWLATSEDGSRKGYVPQNYISVL
jgi:myosin-7